MIRLLLLVAPIFSFNVCLVDRGACIPLEDFEVNCTCILTPGKPINATDDTFMFLLGHQIPFHLFKQVEISSLFRRKLKQRLPPDHDFEFPEHIIRNLRVEERTALFLVNTNYSDFVLSLMANESASTGGTQDFSGLCSEGECNVFTDRVEAHNLTAGTYSHAADVLQVISQQGQSIFAVSSVKAEFDMPKVQKRICASKCERFQPQDSLMCRRLCTQRMRFDNVAMIGQLKRDFQMFIRAAAVKNLKDKYYKYLG